MDLLDFAECELYFEEPLSAEAEGLIAGAAQEYGKSAAERDLLYAHLLAPESLTVLVALYRYYFYQHRLQEALAVSERAMRLSARHLSLPDDWSQMDEINLAAAASRSFGLLRFHLLALKAASIVLLRLGETDAARARLAKLTSLDSRDQLGVAKLLEVVDEYRPGAAEVETN